MSYADPKIADKVLEEDHTIDGKKVEFSLESTTYCHFFLYLTIFLRLGLCLKRIFYLCIRWS